MLPIAEVPTQPSRRIDIEFDTENRVSKLRPCTWSRNHTNHTPRHDWPICSCSAVQVNHGEMKRTSFDFWRVEGTRSKRLFHRRFIHIKTILEPTLFCEPGLRWSPQLYLAICFMSARLTAYTHRQVIESQQCFMQAPNLRNGKLSSASSLEPTEIYGNIVVNATKLCQRLWALCWHTGIGELSQT